MYYNRNNNNRNNNRNNYIHNNYIHNNYKQMSEDSNVTTLIDENVETLESVVSDKSTSTDLVCVNKGWTEEQESIVKGWTDIATCYRYLHDYTEKNFNTKKLAIMIPAVILSTVGGASSIMVQTLLSTTGINTSYINITYINVILGLAALLAGLLTVLGNTLGYAALEQSHSSASLYWGKFQHVILIELELKPSKRTKSSHFLRSCRADLNRLIERTPEIPDAAFATIEKQVANNTELNTPNFRKAFEQARIYESSETRMNLAIESAKLLMNKPPATKNKN